LLFNFPKSFGSFDFTEGISSASEKHIELEGAMLLLVELYFKTKDPLLNRNQQNIEFYGV